MTSLFQVLVRRQIREEKYLKMPKGRGGGNSKDSVPQDLSKFGWTDHLGSDRTESPLKKQRDEAEIFFPAPRSLTGEEWSSSDEPRRYLALQV